MSGKKAFLIISLMFLCFSVFADSQQLGDVQKIITAYKNKKSEGVPIKTVQLRLTDSKISEFEDGEKLGLPVDARSIDYSSFSWILSGTVWKTVTLSFSFSPMYLRDKDDYDVLDTTSDSSKLKVIPYTVTLRHTSTKVGNSQIPSDGRASQSTVYSTNSFAKQYKFKYSDTVTLESGSLSVTSNTGIKSTTISYDMSTNTAVVYAYGNNEGQNAKVAYNNSAYSEICDSWNRYGAAYIRLDVSEDDLNNNMYNGGTYAANVSVEITAGI